MKPVYQQHDTTTTHKNITKAQVLRAALAYAGKGIPVFPCKPGAKEPLTRNGFKDASTDPRKIHAWWNAHPLANVAHPTGKASGIISLDVDTYKTGAWSLEDVKRELGPLPNTRVISTGRGGLQYLYAHPEGEELPGSQEGTLGPGVCVKSKGGYVVAPPSFTEGPYTVLNDAPIADAPEWLLEAPRRPQSAAHGEKPHSPAPIGVGPGEPIREGQRNWSLYRYASALRGQGFDQAAILGELENINARLCKPPLDAGEVEKIASSAAKHEPGNASPGASAEVLEALDGIEEVNLWGRTWKGQSLSTPYKVFKTLLGLARRHGQGRKNGVFVSVGVRQLALAAGVSKQALTRSNGAIDKIVEMALIRRVKGSGTKSGGYVLLGAVTAGPTQPQSAARPSSGSTSYTPTLRYSKPVYESMDGILWRVGTVRRLGPSCEKILDALGRNDGRMSEADLGTALGAKNRNYLRNTLLPRLDESGVVECSADGVQLRPGWLSALNRRREEDQEIADYERDKKRYAEESRVYALKLEARKLHRVGMEIGELAAELRVGTEDVYRLLDIARPLTQPYEAPPAYDGFVEELEHAPDQQEDRMDHIEDFDFADEDRAEDFDGIETKPLSPLAVAIRRYLDDHPDDSDQTAYWLGATCWAFDLLSYSPLPAESRDALQELGLRPARHLEAVA